MMKLLCVLRHTWNINILLKTCFILVTTFSLIESRQISSIQSMTRNELLSVNRFSQSPQWGSNSFQASRFVPTSSAGGGGFNMNELSVPGMGKLRLLSVLFSGLRNTGLEATIAGEVLQRLIRVALKDLIVPFKSNMFSGFS